MGEHHSLGGSLREQADRIERKVDLALKLIRGESEPERSIIGRLQSAERDIEDLRTENEALKAERKEKTRERWSFGAGIVQSCVAAAFGAVAGYLSGGG
jgi:hypothetical protein